MHAALARVDLAQMERRRRIDLRHEGGEGDEGLRGFEGQGVLAPRALLRRPRPERLGLGRDHLGVERDHDRARQVLPRGNGRARHERQKLRRFLFGQAAVELLQQARQIARAREALGQAPAQLVQDRSRCERVRQRMRLQRFDDNGRALGLGIEPPEALHRVAQELDPYRSVAVGRKDVHDAAAAADLAGSGDRVLPPVAAFGERLEQDLGRHLVAGPQAEHARGEQAAVEAGPKEARGRGDQGPHRAPARGVEGDRALEGRVGMSGQAAAIARSSLGSISSTPPPATPAPRRASSGRRRGPRPPAPGGPRPAAAGR